MSNTMVNTILNKTNSAITIVKQSINAAVGTVNILELHGTFQKVDGWHPNVDEDLLLLYNLPATTPRRSSSLIILFNNIINE